GEFCVSTQDAVRAFQEHRGLHVHGDCDEPTWLALVEASWRLGNRPLRLMAPFLRGDDVGTLQSWLGRLGFDCGRVDGIFGPATARALEDFQRNCGLDVDGVCGSATVRALEINGARTGSGPGVATIRELEQLSSVGTSLRQLRVVVGQFGGLGPLARHVAQRLRHEGAKVITADELDPSMHAAAANRYAATVYIGFEPRTDEHAAVAYYATAGFESAGGRSLADRIERSFSELAALSPVTISGMRLPVLRETRMTAVVCSLGPVQRVVDTAPAISDAVVSALAAWAAAPVA
ncbi:MAG: peptidoglycan-binding protein, partial [Ilumatobacteraceae bacterium]